MATHPARRGWSYAEFARLPDDGNRYEVIGGELYVTPGPRRVHQEVAARLQFELRGFATVQQRLGPVLGPLDVIFAEGDYLAPDLMFIREDHLGYETERGFEGPPDLVVEVLSPTTALRDRTIKRERYAAYGVPEYWIVDVEARRVEVYRPGDEGPSIHTERLAWHPVEGGPVLELDLGELFADLD